MAACAVGPEPAVVDVVRLVAIGAVATQLHLRCQWLPVAGLAIASRMCTFKHESGLSVVVKKCLFPLHRGVAKRASFAEAPTMGIAFLVTVGALLRCVAEYMRVMALAAFLLVMFAKQREASQAMVEKDVILPGNFAMAVRARNAKRAVVSVVVFVAGQAV